MPNENVKTWMLRMLNVKTTSEADWFTAWGETVSCANCGPKMSSSFSLFDDRTVFPQFISSELWLREDGGISVSCSHIFVWYIFKLLLWIARPIVVTDSVFGQCSWAHVLISVTVLMQYCLRAWRSHASNIDFKPCPLCREISPDSHNHLMVLCTVHNEIFITSL